MKELVIRFYKSNRVNSKMDYKTYCVYDGKNAKKVFKKNTDFYDAVNQLEIANYKYVSVALVDYNNGNFFPANDFAKWSENMLEIPETPRYDTTTKTGLIHIIKAIYYFMILVGADFGYDYNPFKDNNVIYHLGEI